MYWARISDPIFILCAVKFRVRHAKGEVAHLLGDVSDRINNPQIAALGLIHKLSFIGLRQQASLPESF